MHNGEKQMWKQTVKAESKCVRMCISQTSLYRDTAVRESLGGNVLFYFLLHWSAHRTD